MDVADPDLLDNWNAAALIREQPLTAWYNGDPRIIGPSPTPRNEEIVKHILFTGEATAANIAKKLNLQLTNASTKLWQLVKEGFILRREEVSPTGGIEFRYFRIG